MPDWKRYICDHLPALGLAAEREVEIIEELAFHLRAVYEAALADGLEKVATMGRRYIRWSRCDMSEAPQPS